MSGLSDHLKGLAITGFGVLVLSPDALLLRLLSVDHWTTVMWRGVLMGLTLSAVMAVLYRRWDRVPIKRYDWEEDDSVPDWFPEKEDDADFDEDDKRH